MFSEKVFKALADKNRRKIIQLLNRQELTAGEIAEQFNISKPAISEHLKILRNAGLIDSEREGQFIRYFLNTSILEEVVSFFLAIIHKEEE